MTVEAAPAEQVGPHIWEGGSGIARDLLVLLFETHTRSLSLSLLLDLVHLPFPLAYKREREAPRTGKWTSERRHLTLTQLRLFKNTHIRKDS